MKLSAVYLLAFWVLLTGIGCQFVATFDHDKINSVNANNSDSSISTGQDGVDASASHVVPTGSSDAPMLDPRGIGSAKDGPKDGSVSDAATQPQVKEAGQGGAVDSPSSGAGGTHWSDTSAPSNTGGTGDTQASRDAGWKCADDSMCRQDQYCNESHECIAQWANDRGLACSRDRQCDTWGGCCGGTCVLLTSEAHCGASAGDDRQSCGEVCLGSQYCNLSSRNCIPRLSTGDTCGENRQCISNRCCNEECISDSLDDHCGKFDCGQPCSANEFCKIDQCAPKGEFQAACVSANQCISNTCYAGRCTCVSDNDCINQDAGRACLSAIDISCGCNDNQDCANRRICDIAQRQCAPPPAPPGGSGGGAPPPP